MGRRSLLLFLFVWVLVAFVTRTHASSAHEWSRLGTIDSLVERGSYELETSRFHGSTDKILFGGHYYSHQPPLLATLESPVYWLIRRFGLQFWNSAPFDLAYFLFTWLTNGLALAFTVVLMDRILERFAVPPARRAIWAVLLPLSTWLLPYGIVTNNHGISGMLLTLTAWALIEISTDGATTTRAAILGGSLGLLAAIEVVPIVSFVPLGCLFVARRSDTRAPAPLGAFALGLAAPLMAHAILNVPLTGDIRPGGFHTELFNYPGSKFASETLTGQLNHGSVREFVDYSWRALVSEKGYFTFAPALLAGLVAGLVGWTAWSRARGAHLVLLAGSIASLVAALVTTNNFGGAAVGFRHAAYLSPAFLVMLAPFLARARAASAAAVTALLAASAALLLIVAAPQPWSTLSYPPPAPSIEWQRYAPVVAHAADRMQRKVDEFGEAIADRQASGAQPR